jgi:hypothetical protein
VSAIRPHFTHSLGAGLDSVRLKRRMRDKTVAIAWMREYLREEPEPRVAPRYLRQAIAACEAQLETMTVQLRHLTPNAAGFVDQRTCPRRGENAPSAVDGLTNRGG